MDSWTRTGSRSGSAPLVFMGGTPPKEIENPPVRHRAALPHLQLLPAVSIVGMGCDARDGRWDRQPAMTSNYVILAPREPIMSKQRTHHVKGVFP